MELSVGAEVERSRVSDEERSIPGDTEKLTPIIKAHLTLYPAMQARDVYKLLYQSVCGAEHLMSSASAFEEYLRAEFDAVTALDEESLLVSLRADGTLSRINLRPYKARGGTVAALMRECMRATLPVDQSARDELRRAWGAFRNGCQAGNWSSLSLIDVMELDSWLMQHDYPAVHHSDAFRQTYRPAYRLAIASPFI